MEKRTFVITPNLLEASEAAGVELARLRYCLEENFQVTDVTATWVTALLLAKITSVTSHDEEYRQVLSSIITEVSNYLNEPTTN